MLCKVGLPGWRIAAKLGVPLGVNVEITHDPEANVFIATSPNLQGLVVETESFEDLLKEIQFCANDLLQDALHRQVQAYTKILVMDEVIA